MTKTACNATTASSGKTNVVYVQIAICGNSDDGNKLNEAKVVMCVYEETGHSSTHSLYSTVDCSNVCNM